MFNKLKLLQSSQHLPNPNSLVFLLSNHKYHREKLQTVIHWLEIVFFCCKLNSKYTGKLPNLNVQSLNRTENALHVTNAYIFIQNKACNTFWLAPDDVSSAYAASPRYATLGHGVTRVGGEGGVGVRVRRCARAGVSAGCEGSVARDRDLAV